jgi:hypothetical protein
MIVRFQSEHDDDHHPQKRVLKRGLRGRCLALNDGSAERLATETEITGRRYGVQDTAAWLLDHQLITGLRSAVDFERLAEYTSRNIERTRRGARSLE